MGQEDRAPRVPFWGGGSSLGTTISKIVVLRNVGEFHSMWNFARNSMKKKEAQSIVSLCYQKLWPQPKNQKYYTTSYVKITVY